MDGPEKAKYEQEVGPRDISCEFLSMDPAEWREDFLPTLKIK